jgi:PHD/YefM family antitoxin component YafN of YafNO toxin-antitoxin module
MLMIKMAEAVKHGMHQTEWITISIDEYESMQRTIKVLSDRDLMNQIEEGKRDDVKIRDFEELAKELGI